MFKKRFHINFQNMSHMPLRNVLTSSSVQLLVNKGCKAAAKKKNSYGHKSIVGAYLKMLFIETSQFPEPNKTVTKVIAQLLFQHE